MSRVSSRSRQDTDGLSGAVIHHFTGKPACLSAGFAVGAPAVSLRPWYDASGSIPAKALISIDRDEQ